MSFAEFVNQTWGFGSGIAYGVTGILYLLLGYYVMDWLTPGKLSELIFTDRNRNASALAASHFVAIGLILTTAIFTSADRFVLGIVNLTGFGIVGIGVLALGFKIIDWVTPGKLGELVTDTEPHPAVWVTVAANVALGAVIAASIS